MGSGSKVDAVECRWAVALWLLLGVTSASGQYSIRVSIASDGTQGDMQSWVPSISSDGHFVAFHALASNLVVGDTNDDYDVFVRDRESDATYRVSVSSSGLQANGPSGYGSISPDGRYVGFDSSATNLVAGDTNNNYDAFIRDLLNGTTIRVSVASDGTQGNASSGYASVCQGGQYVAFVSTASTLIPIDTNGADDIFVRDVLNGITTRVSVASDGTESNGSSAIPSISADGRYVAFYSTATNLVLNDTNNTYDVFVHDRQTGVTTRVSVSSDGTQGNNWSSWPSISADGRYVAFYSRATNLVAGDTNARDDVFVRDRDTSTTTRVSVSSAGVQGNNHSGAYGLAISPDGQYVAFESRATNLVTGDSNGAGDVFIRNRTTNSTVRVSTASNGAQANGSSDLTMNRALSAGGRYVAFNSLATNLVADDTNGANDVFVHRYSAGFLGDWDGDDDVDIDDFARFPTCDSGPIGSPDWVMPSQLCRDVFDFDGDSDVDAVDFAAFQAAFGGP